MFSQVDPPCLTRLLGHRLNLAAPFLAWEMLSARCAGGWCLDTVPKGTLPARCAHLSAVSHGPSDCRRGTQLPFPLSAFPPQVPASFCPAPLELRISGPGSSTCGTTPSSLTYRRGRKMGSR